MKILINNILIPSSEYTAPNNEQPSTSITITDIEDGERTSTVSTEYTLTGSAFDIVNQLIIQDPDGKNVSIPVKIYEDGCCESDVLLFEGIIRGDGVDWCYGECTCTVTFMEQTAETLIQQCIESTLIWDNFNNFQTQIHPKIVYCVELRPDFLAYSILIIASIMNVALLLLTPIIAVISLIISVINSIIQAINTLGFNLNEIDFDGDSSTNTLEEWQGLVDLLNQNAIGCGRKHPSPLLRSYIGNVCTKCGITFQSSILNTPQSEYYNTVYFNAPVEKGTRNNNVLWMQENAPILTLTRLIDQLKPVFNAEYDIDNGVLRFERKDFFWNGNIFVSYQLLETSNRIKDKLCLQFRDEPRPAFGVYEYSKDAFDACGTEAWDRFSDKVEWNLPYSNLQSGQKDNILIFATARFRDDGIDQDILSYFDGAPGGIGTTIQNHNSVMILSKGTAFQPKLLIWDQQSSFFARVKKYNIPGFGIPASENYNFPLMFNEWNASPNTAYPTNHPNSGLYPRFHSIDNPKLIIDNGLQFTFSFYYNCESLAAAKTAKFVQLPMGIGRIKNTVVNLTEETITVTGEV